MSEVDRAEKGGEYCSNPSCGKDLANDEVYCDVCGTKLLNA